MNNYSNIVFAPKLIKLTHLTHRSVKIIVIGAYKNIHLGI